MNGPDRHPPETPIPIGLFSVVSIIELRIKRRRRPWRTVRAMAWHPTELAEFLARLRPAKNRVK